MIYLKMVEKFMFNLSFPFISSFTSLNYCPYYSSIALSNRYISLSFSVDKLAYFPIEPRLLMKVCKAPQDLLVLFFTLPL